MKNILLNSCYPPPPPAAKEAPSPVSSLSQLVPRHTLQRTECAPGQHRSRARSVPEVAPEVSQRRRCPSSPAGAVLELQRVPSVPQPRAAGAAVSPLPGGRSALVPSPVRERGGRAHTAILGCSALPAWWGKNPDPPSSEGEPSWPPKASSHSPPSGAGPGRMGDRYFTLLPFQGSHIHPSNPQGKGDSEESLVPNLLPENSAPVNSSNSQPQHCDEHDRNSPKALLHPHKEQ